MQDGEDREHEHEHFCRFARQQQATPAKKAGTVAHSWRYWKAVEAAKAVLD
jgi:hypothetical protein